MPSTNLSYKPLENAKHELFCQKYCSMGTEYFGNGTKSYGLAYWIDISDKKKYNIAKSWAYEILTNPYILKRIDELNHITISPIKQARSRYPRGANNVRKTIITILRRSGAEGA